MNTYLLQYRPPHAPDVPNSDQKHFMGEVTFDRPILAIIANTEQLLATDSSLGKKGVQYPAATRRGLEDGDHISLSQDRRTLRLDWLVMQTLKHGLDQIRVIVDVSDPQTVR